MKKIFTFYVLFTHCININASEQPNKVIARSGACITAIVQKSRDFCTAAELIREKSPETKALCNYGGAACYCASCFLCPKFCLCTTACALNIAESFILCNECNKDSNIINKQP